MKLFDYIAEMSVGDILDAHGFKRDSIIAVINDKFEDLKVGTIIFGGTYNIKTKIYSCNYNGKEYNIPKEFVKGLNYHNLKVKDTTGNMKTYTETLIILLQEIARLNKIIDNMEVQKNEGNCN